MATESGYEVGGSPRKWPSGQTVRCCCWRVDVGTQQGLVEGLVERGLCCRVALWASVGSVAAEGGEEHRVASAAARANPPSWGGGTP